MDAKYLGEIERGWHAPSITSAHRIAQALHVALADLVETTPDASITDDALAAVVKKCIDQFEATLTDKNIRSRAFMKPTAIARATFKHAWSRTNETGRLVHTHLLKPLVRKDRATAVLSDLRVRPHGTEAFNPKRNNWKRRTKVPVLILNATSLGTGHTWQFTASWMGEPPAGLERDVDPAARFERIWLDREAPRRAREVTIADAVASSACVPALFPPLTFDGLYDGWSVRLVDGGVRDNQGIGGLLDQECTEIFISDASGLFATKKRPWRVLASVVKRVGSVSRAAIRTTTFAELIGRARAGTVRSAQFVYLLDGLPAEVVSAAGQPNATSAPATPPVLPKRVQTALAKIRTDLDWFSIAEIYSLMLCGYRLTEHELGDGGQPLTTPESVHNWAFFAIEPLFTEDHPLHNKLVGELESGHRRFGRWATHPAWGRIKTTDLVG